MERVIALLHEVAKRNTDELLHGAFVDPDEGVALAGFRRIYGHGDCLVRVRGDFNMLNFPDEKGFYSYLDSNYYPDQNGLLGKYTADGRRELITAQRAEKQFQEAFNYIRDGFSVFVNPRTVCKFIEEFTKDSGMDNKKINMQVFNGMSELGQFTGQIHTLEDDTIGVIVGGRVFCYIDDKHSLIEPSRLKDGTFVIVEQIGIANDKRIVRLLRLFESGVRLAIQHFRNGLMLDNSAPYSMYEENGNGVDRRGIINLPFLDGQFDSSPESQNQYLKAPIIHFDLDTFYRALKPMEMNEVAQIFFKDSVSPVLISTISTGDMRELELDSLIGTSSPYRRGKVWTP